MGKSSTISKVPPTYKVYSGVLEKDLQGLLNSLTEEGEKLYGIYPGTVAFGTVVDTIPPVYAAGKPKDVLKDLATFVVVSVLNNIVAMPDGSISDSHVLKFA